MSALLLVSSSLTTGQVLGMKYKILIYKLMLSLEGENQALGYKSKPMGF